MPRYVTQIYNNLACAAQARGQKQHEAAVKRHGGERPLYIYKGFYYTVIDGRQIAEHRRIYEETRNVKLLPTHRVKFINGDRFDLRPENLALENPFLEKIVQETGKLPSGNVRLCSTCGGKRTGVVTSRATGKKVYYCKPCNTNEQARSRMNRAA